MLLNPAAVFRGCIHEGVDLRGRQFPGLWAAGESILGRLLRSKIKPLGGNSVSTAPTPSPAASGGLEPNIAGLLCYSPVGLICDIIWLVAEPYKSNKFIRFHAFQSLFLCGALFALFIALWILGFILGMIAGPL